MKKYKCDELQKVVDICKANGIKVYGFQTNTPISQILLVDGSGNIGSVSEYFGGLRYSTVHKRSDRNGTGFMLSDYGSFESASLELIKRAMLTIKPFWANGDVIKYKNWDEYISDPVNSILTYFEI